MFYDIQYEQSPVLFWTKKNCPEVYRRMIGDYVHEFICIIIPLNHQSEIEIQTLINSKELIRMFERPDHTLVVFLKHEKEQEIIIGNS